MTVGAGLYLSPVEQDQQRQNGVIRQLIEGRSNAVGTVALTGDGVATATVVTAPTCGFSSAVFLFPATAHAAALTATTFVQPADVTKGQFTVRHAATSFGDVTFFWACLG